MRGIFLLGGVFAVSCFAAGPVTLVDFAREDHGWRGNPRTRDARQSNGFTVELTGEEDPWLEGPEIAIPGRGDAQKLVLTLDAECGEDGAFQLFFASPGQNFTADASIFMTRSETSSEVYKGVLPLASDRLRFRLDPPGAKGHVTLRTLRALPLTPRAATAFVKPADVVLPDTAWRVESGPVLVVHDPVKWNAFACFVGGQKMAQSNPAETLAYIDGNQVKTVVPAAAVVFAEHVSDGILVRAKTRDPDGAVWHLSRRIVSDRGGVRIETSVSVDAVRDVIHLPWLTLFAGVGTFGESKRQALLPGVEYLDCEPSSNEKEIRGTASNRRMVDAYKVCYPMMALAASGQWVSVIWKAGAIPVSPLFDSPDRVFNSGGHVLGLWSPAVGDARFESEFTLYGGVRLEVDQTYTCTVTVCGDKGDVVTEAVSDYVARSGLPALPRYANGFEDAVRLLASGWLDSAAHEGGRWRHAVWGKSFPAAQAEDVPAYLLYLAAHVSDSALKARLTEASRTAIANLPAGCFGVGGISHVKRPVGALLYGNVEGLVRQAGPRTAQLAKQLSEGVSYYRPGKTDYASTLGSDHCNGFTAMSAEEMLSNASLTGDETAIRAALAVLDNMTARYTGQVPRGAQPWEMPLHTPDIVASARLVRCYVLGYLLSGQTGYLEQARYWAWTGMAMIYLSPPTEGDVGLYATIGVIGATNWQAPNWIGQPVQWCGLVYRSALEDLARVDESQRDLWQTLARGMTITALKMCFPVGDEKGRGGLLPDYFLLRQQKSDGPAINPSTVQTHLAEAYGKIPMYTVTRLDNGSLVHAPGVIRQEKTGSGAMRVTLTVWPESEYQVLITRFDNVPEKKILWNDVAVTPRFMADSCTAIMTLRGNGMLVW
ncbi:MAG TPA: hypothetical protein PKM57_03210 [Kiritimatiellia bacterium]|nr:hypothetical protein [Kiritimatiellia bacterium]HPS06024.1 hypothetical protein [Kiritimatiellia bacterium]